MTPLQYINILPKELRLLLDKYANYDYWSCLSNICSHVSTLDEFIHNKAGREWFEGNIKHLRDSLTQCESELKSRLFFEPGFSDVVIYMTFVVAIHPETVINRESFLKILQLFSKYLLYTPDINLITEIINQHLEKHKFIERLVNLNYFDDRHEVKIVKITDFIQV